MLESIGLFQLTDQRMRYLARRQAIIGQNIANADTPGYQAKDLSPFSTSLQIAQKSNGVSLAGPLQLVADAPGQIGFGASGTVSAKVNQHAKSYSEKLDKNNVSVEEQEMKANDVADAYSLATAAYTQSMNLLKDSLAT